MFLVLVVWWGRGDGKYEIPFAEQLTEITEVWFSKVLGNG